MQSKKCFFSEMEMEAVYFCDVSSNQSSLPNSDTIRCGRGFEHHQGVDRVDDRGKRLRPLQGGPMDELGGRVVSGLTHKTAKALQIYR